MNQSVSVIVFDPSAHSFTKSSINHFEEYYPLLSFENNEVTLFDIVSIEPGLDIYIDDEGLLKQEFYLTKLFNSRGDKLELAGKLIFVGSDNDGNSISVSKSMKYIQSLIKAVYHYGQK
jgi:hypothetical protein